MNAIRRSSIALLLVSLALFLAACTSTPGPVQPTVGPKAPGVLVITPELQPYLDVPAGNQAYRYNQQNLLEYNTVVRNKGTRAMNLSYTVYCLDGNGSTVETQDPITFFIDPNSEYPIKVTANHKDAKEMRIQIRPAK